MTNATVDQITTATKANVETLTASGTAALGGFQNLAKVYQDLATQNVEKLTASFHALISVKSPTDLIALQQNLVKDGVESAVDAGRKIAELTSSIFTTAFEPVKKQVEAVQKNFKN